MRRFHFCSILPPAATAARALAAKKNQVSRQKSCGTKGLEQDSIHFKSDPVPSVSTRGVGEHAANYQDAVKGVLTLSRPATMGAQEARLWAVPPAPRSRRYGICPLSAAVVLAPAASLDEQPVRDALAKYKLPKRVIFVEDLPRNAMGKVQKNLLRERFGDLFVSRAGNCS